MRVLNIKNFFLCALALGVFACGDDDENTNIVGSSPAPINQNPQTPAGPTDPNGGPLLITGGNFISEPITEVSRKYRGKACSTYEVSTAGTQLSQQQKVFENADCTGALLGEILLTGSITELELNSTSRHNYSLTIQSVRMIPRSILWTQNFGVGNSGDCQTELMPLNVETDIAGKKCGILGTFPAVDDVFQSRYQFDGQDTLRMTLSPYELPNSVNGASESAAPRATRMNVRYQRIGSGTPVDTSTDTSTSTATETSTSSDTDSSIR